jgi:holo-[acyl-carrier protein] synthase
MERALGSRWAHRFIKRVFHETEIENCNRAPNRSEAFASRFAAKEALVKALGVGFSKGVQPAQIWVAGGERQRPRLELAGRARQIAEDAGVTSIHVSLTHTRSNAAAMVVIEGNL